MSIVEQCDLLDLPRSSYYYEPVPESAENLALMRMIDEQYLMTPYYGSRRMTDHLVRAGQPVNRKRIQRLMRMMGLEGVFPGKKTTTKSPQHKVYPYLLRGLVERLWRSVKYEDIYLKDYTNGADLMEGLTQCFDHYTHRRPHQGLARWTPYEVYHGIHLAT